MSTRGRTKRKERSLNAAAKGRSHNTAAEVKERSLKAAEKSDSGASILQRPPELSAQGVNSIIVSISFYSYFKDLTGCALIKEQRPAGSTIADLLSRVEEKFPKLGAMRKSMLLAVGVEYQTSTYVLKEGDEVSLFPPVQGG